MRISESVASYTYNKYEVLTVGESTTLTPSYTRLQSKAEIDIRKKHLSQKHKHSFAFRNVFIQEDDYYFELGDNGEITNTFAEQYMVNELSYRFNKPSKIFPQSLFVAGEMGDDYSKISFTYNTKIHYPGTTTGVDVRVFAGTFLQNGESDKHYFTLAGNNGYYDDMYDEIYLGRNTQNMFISNQISLSDGFFKVPVYDLGLTSDGAIAAANLDIAIPRIPLVGLFGDIAYVSPNTEVVGFDAFQYDAGIMIKLPKNIFAMYFPLLMSENLSNQFVDDVNTYGDKISFMLSLNALNLFEIARKMEF